ncbi:MAG: type II secretion system F family protein [Candidatus Thermoplasmatota archaeon]
MKKIFDKPYDINKRYGKDITVDIIICASIGLATLFFILGFFALIKKPIIPTNFFSAIDYFVFGVLGCIGPIGFYNHLKMKRRKEVEDHLPDLLRDIANSSASGMTIYDSIRIASEGDYGGLTSELKMMTAQLSWGIPINEALTNFAKRVNTNEVKRLAITINKALEIGGNTAAVFNSAAKELDQIKRVEQQRRVEMSMYSIVIFISFFVFLAVIIVINTTIFSAIFDIQGKMAGKAIGGLRIAQIDPTAVRDMFFTFVFVQSMGGGLLGGFMMEGNISSGIRQAFILVLVSLAVFKIMF